MYSILFKKYLGYMNIIELEFLVTRVSNQIDK